MSKKAVYNLLTRAFLDPDFRQELEADVSAAADKMGEAVTPEEVEEIRKALEEGEAQTTVGLDQRLSKSGVSLSPHAMLRQKGGIGKREFMVVDYRTGEGKNIKRRRSNEASKKQESVDIYPEKVSDDDEPDYEVERG